MTTITKTFLAKTFLVLSIVSIAAQPYAQDYQLSLDGVSGEDVAKLDAVSIVSQTILELASDDGAIDSNSNFLSWSDGGTALGVIRGDGNVGIGTASPIKSLHVNTGQIALGPDTTDGTIVSGITNDNRLYIAPYDDSAWQWAREFGYS